MRAEAIHPLDPETLKVFASKDQMAGTANAVKVRRVLQILRDLAAPSGSSLRVLDLACGEGVYSIETALRGAEVLALDARTERMGEGARAAERLRLSNLRFEQNDVRAINVGSHGEFDVILFLGILYHLDVPDVFHVVKNLHDMCRQMVVIDTHVCINPSLEVEHDGRTYRGGTYREHADHDAGAVRRTKLMSSVDNTLSFWFTKKSLIELLCATGFTSVLEVHAPLEAFKPENRITLVALKGTPVRISAYPWLNDKTEEEINDALRTRETLKARNKPALGSIRERIRNVVNRILRPMGCAITRV